MPARITKKERERLLEAAWYLNLDEMKALCQRYGLPHHICVEKADGGLKRTNDRERKDVVVGRILDFALKGRRAEPTVYARSVVADGPLPEKITARTRIRYNQYEKKNPAFVAKLVELTDGAYELGMISRFVLRDFWTAGVAPTMKQFAEAWIEATAAHTEARPEGAYLVDLQKGKAGPGWKAERAKKAKEAMVLLDRLTAGRV